MSESLLLETPEDIVHPELHELLAANEALFATSQASPALLGDIPGFAFTPKAMAGWVGKNLASGVVGAIGGLLFGKALDAIGLGEPDLAKMLTDISNRLAVVEQTVTEIKKIVEEILKELRELRVSMDQYFGEGQLGEAFTQIDDAYGVAPLLSSAAPAGASAPSFMELLLSLPKTKTPAQLDVFARDFVQAENNKWKITTQITSIHNVLTSEVGHGSSLLVRWTDGLLLAIENEQLTLQAAYATLEGYFLQAVGKQLIAVSMHCFSLGNDPARIEYFVQTDFGSKMRDQTSEFLRAIEKLVLGHTTLLKVPSVFDVDHSAEFPGELEAILLRADLLCASLNLVGNKRTVASPKQAIAGIYGRALARRTDFGQGESGPSITIPGGYPPSNGVVSKTVSHLHAIDLRREGNSLLLRDYADSSPVMVRYFWPWLATLPPQNVPLDPRFRWGVRPLFYNVFDDNDWPLAAGFFDFSRVLLGDPADAPSNMTENSKFRAADAHSVIKQPDFVPSPLHPLVRPQAGKNHTEWSFAHTWKTEGTWLCTKSFHLFKYSGRPAKVRIHVNVVCEVEHHKGSPTWGDNDMNARMSIAKKNGPRGPLFYNSESEGGGVLFLIHKRGHYKRSLDSWVRYEFDVTEGEYSLALDLKSWVGDRTWFEKFDGWDIDSLKFDLNGLFIEWV